MSKATCSACGVTGYSDQLDATGTCRDGLLCEARQCVRRAQKALADEKAVTAELTRFVEFVAREVETGDARLNFSRGSSLAHALSNALARVRGGNETKEVEP